MVLSSCLGSFGEGFEVEVVMKEYETYCAKKRSDEAEDERRLGGGTSVNPTCFGDKAFFAVVVFLALQQIAKRVKRNAGQLREAPELCVCARTLSVVFADVLFEGMLNR